MSCKLCRPITKKTKWYYQDDKITILNCDRCIIPMWIWHKHQKNLTEDEIKYGRDKCRKIFGDNITFRKPRLNLDHYHEHVIRR